MAVNTEDDVPRGGPALPVRFPFPIPVSTITQLPSPALGGAIGCDFRKAANQLLFVEYSGNLSAMNLFPPATVIATGTVILAGGQFFDLDTGTLETSAEPGADVSWQTPASGWQMAPANDATLINLGPVDYVTLSSAGLQNLPYSGTPIPGSGAAGQIAAGDVFAVQTTAGNLAKVLVNAYGPDLTLTWTTYQLQAMYQVLGTGYVTPEDVKASSDGEHAYVTERTGDLVLVALGSADRSTATVVATGMTAPQQLFLDEIGGAAYTVEYAPSGRLLRIDLATGTTTTMLSGLENAVGVVLSSDCQYAYISEQTTGSDQGRVSRFQLSNGQRTGLATGLTAPFFLTWSDASQTVLLVPERDPENLLTSINVLTQAVQTVASGLPFRPSSVAVAGSGTLLVCCDQVIDEITLPSSGSQPDGPLLEGIGFVPAGDITGGLATISEPYFQADGAPFGGGLPVLVNFLRAGLDGASYYQVQVDGNVRTDVFQGQQWDGTQYVPATFGTTTMNGSPGYYPVPAISELMLWLGTLPGCYLDSTTLVSAQTHTITVDFYAADGTLLESAAPLTIYVDNNRCTATLTAPTLLPSGGGASVTANPCGLLSYGSAADQVEIPFTASQPEGFATYQFSLVRGVTPVPVSQPASGPVSGISLASDPIEESVAALLGSCPTAGFAVEVYVYASAVTGWARCSQYDAEALEGFVLAPAPLPPIII